MLEPSDPPDALAERWFVSPLLRAGGARPLSARTSRAVAQATYAGNDIEFFADYQAYYTAIGRAFDTLRPDANDFVYLAGWAIDREAYIDPPSVRSRRTLGDVIEVAARKAGMTIRAILDSSTNSDANEATANWLNGLPGTDAFLDQTRALVGSHHQKLVVLRGGSGLMAFCGGMDFDRPRLGRGGLKPGELPAPTDSLAGTAWQDVHLQIRGPGAAGLWFVFCERWTNRKGLLERGALARFPPGPRSGPKFMPDPSDFDTTAGNHLASVLTTYPRKTVLGLWRSPLTRLPESTTYARQLLACIERSRRFIYLEEQYMVGSAAHTNLPSILDALVKRLEDPEFQAFIAVLARTETIEDEMFQAYSRRREVYEALTHDSATSKKVHIFAYKPDAAAPYWVHSKAWIFDDRCAIVGSANFNRRSMSHDSEVGLVVSSPNPRGDRLLFAHGLRTALWLQHLNRRSSTDRTPTFGLADVLDPMVGLVNLAKAPLLERLRFDATGAAAHPDIDPLTRKIKHSGLRSVLVRVRGAYAGGALTTPRDVDWSVVDPDGS